MVSGHRVPILSAWSALKTKEIKLLQVLFSLSLCLNICASLALCALSGLWSFLGDCAASLSRTFITATRAGGIIYSSTGCAAWHTLLIFIWVRGGGGRQGGGVQGRGELVLGGLSEFSIAFSIFYC